MSVEKVNVIGNHLKETSSEDDGIVVRLTRPEDLPQIETIAQDNHFDVGLHNLQFYYQSSPHSWFVAVNKQGQVVAYDSYNDLGNEVFWGFQILVNKEYRGRKLTSRMFNHYGGPLDQCGNSTLFSLQRYHFDYYEFRINGHWGVVTNRLKLPPLPRNLKIVKITEENIANVISYDKTILTQFNRDKFLRGWLLADSSIVKSLAAIDDNGKVVGFGAIRLYSDFHMINPCYADTSEVGLTLLVELAGTLKPTDPIFMESLANNKDSEFFANQLNLLKTSTETRVYKMPQTEFESRFKGKIPEKKVFAIQDYWPI